jgi:glutamate racemase
VGVIGTRATIASQAYDDAFHAVPGIELATAACPRFVEFVERGETYSPELLELAEEYLTPLQRAAADTVVLGCTHYPLLTGVLSLVLGEGVTLVSSAEETAKDVYRVLARSDAFRDPELPEPVHRFLATGDPEPFERLGRRFLGPEVGEVSRAVRDAPELAGTRELAGTTELAATTELANSPSEPAPSDLAAQQGPRRVAAGRSSERAEA